MAYDRYGGDGFCLPNDDQLHWLVEAVAYAQVLTHATVPDGPYIKHPSGVWCRRVSDTFAF